MGGTKKLVCAESDKKKQSLLAIGDVHYGHPTSEHDKFHEYIAWAVDNDAWILLMGDLIENSTKRSVGAGVYEQIMNPEQQIQEVIAALQEPAERGLILGLLTGNHEERTFKDSGIDPSERIAHALNVPYFRYSGFLKLKVQDENYIIYATHGSSGSRHLRTKMKAVEDLSNYNEADAYLHAHVHELASWTKKKRLVNIRNRTVDEHEKWFCITGHYLEYDDSYAEMKGMTPGKSGSPRIDLSGDHWDIHISA